MNLITNKLARNALLLAVTSGGSYIFGLLRDRLLAHTFGAGREVDIFNSAFLLPDLVMNVFAAAITTAFIPVFAKSTNKYKVANEIFTVISVALVAGAGSAFIFMPWLAQLVAPGFSPEDIHSLITSSRLLLLSPILFGLSTLLGAVLQAKHRFFAYAISPMLYNVGICIGILVFSPWLGIAGAILGVVLGASLHMGVRLFAVWRQGYRPTFLRTAFKSREVVQTLALIGPRVVGLLAVQGTLWTFNAVGSTLPHGSVAMFNFARNFQSLPVSFIGIAIATVLFPTLADAFASNEHARLRSTASKAMAAVIALTIPAMLLMMGVSHILVSLLLGGGEFDAAAVATTSFTLVVFSLAIPLESLQHILARIFYAQHNTKYPAIIGVVAALANIVVCILAVKVLGVAGLAVGFVATTAIIDLGLLIGLWQYGFMKRYAYLLGGIIILGLIGGGLAYANRGTIRDWMDSESKAPVPTAVSYTNVNVAVNENSNVNTVTEEPFVIPDEYNLAIPFTSQAPHGKWELPYGEACEEASILMAARFLQGRSIDGADAANAAILELVNYNVDELGQPIDTTAAETVNLLEAVYPDLDGELLTDFTIEDIKTAVAQGYPVIIPAAGRELGNPNFTAPGPIYHMLVVKGYTATKFITNDPGTRKGADYTYDYDVLLDAVHDWNGGDVANGDRVIIVVKPKV